MKTNASGSAEYYFYRAAYLFVKPGAIFFAAKLLSKEYGNLLSLAILIASTLMASLSFGSYKSVVRAKNKDNITHQKVTNKIRKGIFIFNILGLGFLTLLICLLLGDARYAFIFIIIVCEHIIHDETRLILYSGNRERWAKVNFYRSLYLPFIPIVCYLLSIESYVGLFILSSFFFISVAIYSFNNHGLLYINKENIFFLFSNTFFKRYVKLSSYFLSSFLSKGVQQLDRYLVAFLFYESLWVYSLLSQIATFPLTFFEMSFMSRYKEKVSRKKAVFSLMGLKNTFYYWLVSFFASTVYIVLSLTILKELYDWKFAVAFVVAILTGYVSAIVMLNNESLFWKIKKPSLFSRLEFQAFIVGASLGLIFVVFFSVIYLAKVPNLLVSIMRLRNSWKYLKR